MFQRVRLTQMGSLFLCALIGCLHSATSEAHTRSESFSKWVQDGQHYRFVFVVDARRVTQLAALYQHTDIQHLLKQHLEETLTVTQEGLPCIRQSLQVAKSVQGTVRATGSFVCAQAGLQVRAHISSFSSVSSTHVHLASVRYLGRDSLGKGSLGKNKRQKYVLTGEKRSFSLSVEAAPQSFTSFTQLGFTHVLSGLDHLAFLLALLLAAGTVGRAIWCITGFTLGHSLTLAAMAFGHIWPQSHLIESLIGFTIAFAAIEIARSRQGSSLAYKGLALVAVLVGALSGQSQLFWFSFCLAGFALSMHYLPAAQARRWLALVAVAFGLAHGAGFAGGLLAFDLNKDSLLIPLFGFNTGVEVAQISLALLAYAIWKLWLRCKPAVASLSKTKLRLLRLEDAFVLMGLASVLFGLGIYWFAQRLWQNGLIF